MVSTIFSHFLTIAVLAAPTVEPEIAHLPKLSGAMILLPLETLPLSQWFQGYQALINSP